MSKNDIYLNTNGYNNFNNFIYNYTAKKDENYTHTRIGDKNSNIYGGCYNITDNDLFYKKYYKHVFIEKNQEYLTEKQLIDDGPLLVDIDLRFNNSVIRRQHTKEHIIDLLNLYATKFNVLYDIENNYNFNVYVLEKPNICISNNKVKDGIHLIFTIKMHKSEQSLIRKYIINDIECMWDNMNITNSYEEVFDEGVTKGYVNWQLFGSQKPNNEAYKLSYLFNFTYNKSEDLWNINEENIKDFNIEKNLQLMSARYNKHKSLKLKNKANIKKDIEKEKITLSFKNIKNNKNNNISKILTDFDKINNIECLNEMLDNFIDEISCSEYEIKETHQFTMILPKNYYEEGSYNKWIRVGWALKNTHEKMFLTWMKFSSQSKKFDFSDISKYYSMWKNFDTKNSDSLTNRSIMFWAKTDNLSEYKKIRQETISFYIEQTLQTMIIKDKVTEFDLAVVLYQLFKDQFVCVSIKNNQWYEYKNCKWNEIDSGNTLRLLISKKMHDIYMSKAHELIETITKKETNDENTDALKIRSSKLGDICILLKTTRWKIIL